LLSSGEEELNELLRRQAMHQPRNFGERLLLDFKNPGEFREKFCLPVDSFAIPFQILNRSADTERTSEILNSAL